MKANLIFLSLILFSTACSLQEDVIIIDSAKLHTLAMQEARIPIKQGIPNESPFWNINSTRFIYAPAFDFAEIKGADSYFFKVVTEPDENIFTFSAAKPWTSLSEIWDSLPIGYINLTVTGINEIGDSLDIAGERRFYRAAIFNGPYQKPVMNYKESARKGLEFLFNSSFLQKWKTNNLPDPEYSLYCYPSKMVVSVIHGMLFYSEIEPDNANEAITIARNAADYLIGISEPEGSPLEYFPPTYDLSHIDATKEYKNDIDAKWAIIHCKEFENQIMLIYPASVADAYLDLYNTCGNKKYYNAALKIAETYKKLQGEDAQWSLLVDTKSGRATSKNFANPRSILSLMHRLENEFKMIPFDINEDKIESLIKDKMSIFDFEGQFEDQQPSKQYMNLANGPAIETAGYYFDLVEEDSSNMAIAESFLRFAEDQFVIWSNPIPEPRPGESSNDWLFFPCALEQYQCYTPIDAHAVSFASIFMKAWRVTGKEIYLAKAISLANAVTISQNTETGMYPTWWNKEDIHSYGWINCGFHDAEIMYELGEELSTLNIQYKNE